MRSHNDFCCLRMQAESSFQFVTYLEFLRQLSLQVFFVRVMLVLLLLPFTSCQCHGRRPTHRTSFRNHWHAKPWKEDRMSGQRSYQISCEKCNNTKYTTITLITSVHVRVPKHTNIHTYIWIGKYRVSVGGWHTTMGQQQSLKCAVK